MGNPVRVLVVDDSALMRKLIPAVLRSIPGMEIAGTAPNGQIALRQVDRLKPDVVTLDLDMADADGLQTLHEIRRRFGIPVIIVGARARKEAARTMTALSLGASDFVTKPSHASLENLQGIAGELAGKIMAAARGEVFRPEPENDAVVPAEESPVVVDRGRSQCQSRSQSPSVPVRPGRGENSNAQPEMGRVIVIGGSAGGPAALDDLLTRLPADFPASIVVALHMPEGFTEILSWRLKEHTALKIKEAQLCNLLVAGRVLIGPGNRHIVVRKTRQGGVAELVNQPPVNGHRPAVDLLFRSAAREFGPQAIGMLLTGISDDGAEGLGAIRAAGGITIAQSPESCFVDRMPRTAIERGYASQVVPLKKLGQTLADLCPVLQEATA